MAIYPASVVSHDSNIQHLQNVKYYERKAYESLRGETVTYLAVDKKPFPMHSGTTMQFFQNNVAGPNTTPVSEGTPGAPIPHFGSITGTVSVLQYSDLTRRSD